MGLIKSLLSKFSKGAAIQSIADFDAVLEMKDGGIVLPILVNKHLDGSEESLNLLRTKIDNYLTMIKAKEFKKHYPKRKYFLIDLNCIKKPDAEILEELELLGEEYKAQKIKFSWRVQS